MRGWIVVAPLAGIAGLVGCVGDEAQSPDSRPDAGSEAGTSDGAATDAGPADADAGRCNPSASFGAPTLVQSVNLPGVANAFFRLTGDEKLAVWTVMTFGDGGVAAGPRLSAAVYQATRPNRDVPFSSPAMLPEFSTWGYVSTLTRDGLTVYLSPDPTFGFTGVGAGGYDIWRATRPTTSTAFGALELVSAVSTGANDGLQFVAADEQELVFTRGEDPPASGEQHDLYLAKIKDRVAQAAVPISELNTAFTEKDPILSDDGLTIFYGSNQPGGGALGALDIWSARRADRTSPFTSPTNVTELNTAASDSPSWISPDGCEIYLVRDFSTVFHALRGK